MLKTLLPIMLLVLATACAHFDSGDGMSCCGKETCCCKDMTASGKKACKGKMGAESADKAKGTSDCCCKGGKSAKKACKGKVGK